jgi:hypothetical protein
MKIKKFLKKVITPVAMAVPEFTQQQKWELEQKAKRGWSLFFRTRERMDFLIHNRLENAHIVREIRRGGEVDLTHLKKLFLDLYDKVGEIVDCPVCFEPMMKDNTFIPNCGHLICKTCRPQIQGNKCPTCRKDLGRLPEEIPEEKKEIDEEDIPLAQLRRRGH